MIFRHRRNRPHQHQQQQQQRAAGRIALFIPATGACGDAARIPPPPRLQFDSNGAAAAVAATVVPCSLKRPYVPFCREGTRECLQGRATHKSCTTDIHTDMDITPYCTNHASSSSRRRARLRTAADEPSDRVTGRRSSHRRGRPSRRALCPVHSAAAARHGTMRRQRRPMHATRMDRGWEAGEEVIGRRCCMALDIHNEPTHTR